MINRQSLLADLQKFLQRIEADLLERSESTEVPEVPAALHAEYEKAAKAERTAQNYEDWRTDTITQAAAAWVLSCVFVRFLEDNSLIDPPKIAGPGDRLTRARDEHELYFRSHPQHTDREYLLSIFGELAKLPGTRDIFGEHNAINDLPNWLSGDAAGELLNFFQKIDASTGNLVHDFTDPNWDTRFLGDLYQDLSETARKKFALLQTPDFVEEFILDRTLDPAIEEFGLVPLPSGNEETTATRFKMIDPACGSGHFLLGAFPRLLERWQRKEPDTNIRELTQRALDSIHGVDINPFAVAIARFRLLLCALRACGTTRLANAPNFKMNLACGDSLYHGRQRQMMLDGIETDESHYFKTEDTNELQYILQEGTFHAVVANPPYIAPQDEAANKAYRKLYSRVCHRQYSLAIPFMERIFRLAIRGENQPAAAGFTGQITANTFMKAEFGKKLVEVFLPTIDLSTVLDSSTAYLPGHGTPTVVVIGRNRKQSASTVRLVSGTVGEPATPPDPRKGLVWNALVKHVDLLDRNDHYANSSDVEVARLHSHPWSVSGGGAPDLKNQMEVSSSAKLDSILVDIGRTTHSGEDAAFYFPRKALWTRGLRSHSVPLVTGENVRDFVMTITESTIFPYDQDTGEVYPTLPTRLEQFLWPSKLVLMSRRDFGETILERGLKWYEHSMFFPGRYRNSRSLVQAFVATHNHYVFDEKGHRVFNRTAPAIKVAESESDSTYHGLLGLLNCSAACFWLKQVCFPKGGDQVGKAGARVRKTIWDEHYNHNSTPIKEFPLTKAAPLKYGRAIHAHSRKLEAYLPSSFVSVLELGNSARLQISQAKEGFSRCMQTLIQLQEELDWHCYQLYGLLDEDLTYQSEVFGISLGERAFEIVMARKMANGQLATTWFERHQSTPITEIPKHWPEDYKALVERRIRIIESNASIAIIEQPEYKRRWNFEPWDLQVEMALQFWLLDRLESYFDFDGRMSDFTQRREDAKEEASERSAIAPLREISMYSIAQLADSARRDPQFMEVGELYRDDPAFDVQALVEELVLAESVPHLPILRYRDSGLRKRAEWEKTWDLQRREDAGESVGTIPVPPKYASADFISTGGARYWSLRGKLDVPKERWISFPHCEGPDGTLVICWAGYDHLQQAQAISAYYVRVQTEFGGSDDPRLIPLLASLIELLPWLKQWHNEPNANFDGLRMGDYFEGFVNEEARALGKTLDEIRAWTPPKGQRGRVAKGQRGKKGQRSKGSKAQSEEGEDQ